MLRKSATGLERHNGNQRLVWGKNPKIIIIQKMKLCVCVFTSICRIVVRTFFLFFCCGVLVLLQDSTDPTKTDRSFGWIQGRCQRERERADVSNLLSTKRQLVSSDGNKDKERIIFSFCVCVPLWERYEMSCSGLWCVLSRWSMDGNSVLLLGVVISDPPAKTKPKKIKVGLEKRNNMEISLCLVLF